MNKNQIVTEDFSNEESRRLYESGWRDEPNVAEQYQEGEQCGGCSFYAPFNADYGLCCHPESRHRLETVFEHFTCPVHEPEGWEAHSFTKQMNKGHTAIPSAMQPLYDEITAITDEFCRTHLNAEYAELARELTAQLCCVRQSPLLKGQAKVWAAAIVYTIGRVNFLSDKAQTPHMKAADFCRNFGVSQASVSAKSSRIWNLMGMMQLDPRWCLPGNLDRNPLAWFIVVNGLPMDARHAPREVQEEAFRQGLIPYLPEEGK